DTTSSATAPLRQLGPKCFRYRADDDKTDFCTCRLPGLPHCFYENEYAFVHGYAPYEEETQPSGSAQQSHSPHTSPKVRDGNAPRYDLTAPIFHLEGLCNAQEPLRCP